MRVVRINYNASPNVVDNIEVWDTPPTGAVANVFGQGGTTVSGWIYDGANYYESDTAGIDWVVSIFDGVTLFPPSEQSFPDAVAAVQYELDASYGARADVYAPGSGALNGYRLFTASGREREMALCALADFKSHVAAGAGSTSAAKLRVERMSDSAMITLTMTYTNGVAVLEAQLGRIGAAEINRAELQAQLDAATDQAGLDAISTSTGWPT